MPYIDVVPGVCRFTLVATLSGRPCNTVLDYDIDTSFGGPTRAEAIVDSADDIIQNWQSQVMAFMGNSYIIDHIDYLDLNSSSGITGTRPPDPAENPDGAVGTAQVPPNTCLLVTKVTSGSRGTRNGRIFIPALPEANVGDDGTISAPNVEAYQDAMDAFLANTNEEGGTYQRHLHVAHLGPHEPPAPTLPTVVDGTSSGVTALLVQNKVATQRRRLRG